MTQPQRPYTYQPPTGAVKRALDESERMCKRFVEDTAWPVCEKSGEDDLIEEILYQHVQNSRVLDLIETLAKWLREKDVRV